MGWEDLLALLPSKGQIQSIIRKGRVAFAFPRAKMLPICRKELIHWREGSIECVILYYSSTGYSDWEIFFKRLSAFCNSQTSDFKKVWEENQDGDLIWFNAHLVGKGKLGKEWQENAAHGVPVASVSWQTIMSVAWLLQTLPSCCFQLMTDD